jgi:hypothetical protein
VKFGGTENLLDVLTQYEIWGFCRLDFNGKIIANQNFGYLGRKPNITELKSILLPIHLNVIFSELCDLL